jgi:predicted ribosome quality control (RQC) complex YloA/Tae2 family protein
MYFDTLTLAAVVDELRAALSGGRIQRAILANQLSIALEVYAQRRRHNLILSAHPQFARVHLSASRPSRGIEGEPPLLLLLRKYVVGGHIIAVEQPELERVVVLSIAKGPGVRNLVPYDATGEDEAVFDEDDETLRCDLVAEVMERRSNIVLVNDDNVVMESIRHVTPLMSRRPIQPREPYELPPRQEKRDPRHATAEGIATLLDEAPGKDLAQALVSAYRGLSPQAAREVAYRCGGRVDAPLVAGLPWENIAMTLRSLWSEPWQPCLARTDAGVPLAYAPYLLAQYAHVEPQPSMSAVLETFYTNREPITAHRQRRNALTEQLRDVRDRLENQRRQLEGEMEQARQLEHLRWEGEMIYAFMHTVQPRQAALEVEGQSIALDPGLSPVENAQARFRAYDKSKSALANVPERLAEVEARLAGLDQLMALLELADGYEQIEEIGREAVEHGYLKASNRKMKGRRLPPLRIESSDGFTMYVGRSAGQNEQVTFKLSAPDDLWLHARNIPGAHVIIKSGGREVPETTLREAAALAAGFSKGRSEAAVDVEVAHRRHVRRVPGGPPGLVTYRAEQTVRVAPRLPNT